MKLPRRRYCLDANTLISAKNGLYGFDIWPEFWSKLEAWISDGHVYSCWNVYEEWSRKDDDLSRWLKNADKSMSRRMRIEPTPEVQMRQRQIVKYVMTRFASGDYKRIHVDRFLSGADPWVIAQAWEDSSCVVTNEKAVDLSSKKVKIPNVCKEFNVVCIELRDMIRELRPLS